MEQNLHESTQSSERSGFRTRLGRVAGALALKVLRPGLERRRAAELRVREQEAREEEHARRNTSKAPFGLDGTLSERQPASGDQSVAPQPVNLRGVTEAETAGTEMPAWAVVASPNQPAEQVGQAPQAGQPNQAPEFPGNPNQHRQ